MRKRMSRVPRLAFTIPRLTCGGVEVFLLRLCPHLRDRGFEVEVITTDEPGEWFERASERLPVTHIAGARRFPHWWHPLRVGRWLAEGDYDVVFMNGDPFSQQSLAMLPDSVVAAPVVHSDRHTAYRLAFANSDAWNVLVAVGPRISKVASERFPRRRVVEIMHGVDLPETAAWARRRAMTGDELRVIFVGRLVQSIKNVLLLPEIIRQCRVEGTNATLTVVGDGPDRAALEARVCELGLVEYVDFVGEAPPEDVYPLLLDHHALLLPSFYEGLPLTLMEAQACGCVPIASALPGVTTPAVRHRRTGWLVRPGHTESFVAFLHRLCRRPATWTDMSEAAHAYVAAKHSVERMVDGYVRLTEEARAGEYPLPRSRRRRLPADPSLYWREFVPGWARAIGRRILRREPPDGAPAGRELSEDHASG
jgi:glycosyltransferase involved in cell wall biosynthesis